MADIKAQISAIDESVLVRPVPELGTLEVTGEDRQSWLAGMVTCGLKSLRLEQGCFGLSTKKNGRVAAELWLIVDAQRILVGLREDLVDSTRESMDHYLVMEDAEIVRPERRYAWWLAHGPLARAVAGAARREGATTGIGSLGELATAIIAAPEGTHPGFTEALLQVEGAVLATPEGWERIRIERMLPRFGVDYQVDCYPQQASLEHLAVSFSKGCYLGQEAVFKLEKRGHVANRLVRLVVDGVVDAICAGVELTTLEGEPVGTVTSAATSEDQTFALGMVRYKQTMSGTELRVAGHTATVSCLSAREQ